MMPGSVMEVSPINVIVVKKVTPKATTNRISPWSIIEGNKKYTYAPKAKKSTI